MELIRDSWNEEQIMEFQEYLKSFENKDKIEWSSNLLKTELPVLAMKTATIYDIVDKIYIGNYLEFLDLMIWEYYENTSINGSLINKIEDFNIKKKYLDIYSIKADNWATCDLLKFNVEGNEDKYFDLALEYIKSDKPFVRRIGLYILFNFINDNYINDIFKLLDTFKNEKHYYVNMMLAWLLSNVLLNKEKKL